MPALKLYRSNGFRTPRLVEASIFQLPLGAESMDGVYNLGVMEHLTEEQIQDALVEFHRVLRAGGKVVLFWPPEFGLTVRFFKLVHFILNDVLRMNIKLHPDEINLVRSREHVERLLRKARFSIAEYYFGAMDAFTQVIVVAEKHADASPASPRGAHTTKTGFVCSPRQLTHTGSPSTATTDDPA